MTNRTMYSNSLTEHVLRALAPRMDPAWIDMKRHELLGTSRLEVLEWIAFSLDGSNKAIAAKSLELQVQDIQALQRVLQNTKWV